MSAKAIFRKALPFLVVLAIIAYEILSGMGAFSGRLGITSALRQSEAGWIYLDEPLDSNDDLVHASTNQYSYSVYPQKGSTDVIVTDQLHHIVSVIVFEDINKGTLGITTTEEYANIHLRNGQVAILSGGEVMEILSVQKANSSGIRYRPEIAVAEPWEAALLVSLTVLFIIIFLRTFIRSCKEDR